MILHILPGGPGRDLRLGWHTTVLG
jgi:hypothetical protein